MWEGGLTEWYRETRWCGGKSGISETHPPPNQKRTQTQADTTKSSKLAGAHTIKAPIKRQSHTKRLITSCISAYKAFITYNLHYVK